MQEFDLGARPGGGYGALKCISLKIFNPSKRWVSLQFLTSSSKYIRYIDRFAADRTWQFSVQVDTSRLQPDAISHICYHAKFTWKLTFPSPGGDTFLKSMFSHAPYDPRYDPAGLILFASKSVFSCAVSILYETLVIAKNTEI